MGKLFGSAKNVMMSGRWGGGGKRGVGGIVTLAFADLEGYALGLLFTSKRGEQEPERLPSSHPYVWYAFILV